MLFTKTILLKRFLFERGNIQSARINVQNDKSKIFRKNNFLFLVLSPLIPNWIKFSLKLQATTELTAK